MAAKPFCVYTEPGSKLILTSLGREPKSFFWVRKDFSATKEERCKNSVWETYSHCNSLDSIVSFTPGSMYNALAPFPSTKPSTEPLLPLPACRMPFVSTPSVLKQSISSLPSGSLATLPMKPTLQPSLAKPTIVFADEPPHVSL